MTKESTKIEYSGSCQHFVTKNKVIKLHVHSIRFSFDPHSKVLWFVVVHFTTLILSDYVRSVVGWGTGEPLLWLWLNLFHWKIFPKGVRQKCYTTPKEHFVTQISAYM